MNPKPAFPLALLASLSLNACSPKNWGSAGTETRAPPGSNVPAAVATTLRFTDLTVGLAHACALTATGKAYCWGSNEYGQLGTEEPLALCDYGITPCSSTPVAVAGGRQYVGISASLRHTCAVTADGQAWCWGFGVGGQLGDGLSTDSAVPVKVASSVPLAAVFLGGSGLIACGLAADGSGYCWGPGGAGGGLGNGSMDGSSSPVAIAGGLTFASLTVGDEHACGLSTSGDAYCWGRDLYGSVGNGPAEGSSSVAVPVSGGLKFSALSAGLAHTCGLGADGTTYCWGFAPAVGSAMTGSGASSPLAVDGGHRFVAISAGAQHTCAVDGSGGAWCWGLNHDGELGDGSTDARLAPVRVSISARISKVRAGGGTCALDASGVAYCWGLNQFGQIGQPPS